MAEPIAVSSSSPDRSSKPKEKPNDWLHIAFVRVFALLVSHVGTEIALGKGKTPSRCLIVSAINRTIHFPTSKGYMMSDHTKERSMMEHPSRRSFLGMSSVALATAALAGLSASAQDKESTHKAEHNNS